MTKIITTSWDDGCKQDSRLAELLNRYGLQGTFYIPKKNKERSVMSNSEIISISKEFEIGGHTINHVRLNTTSKKLLKDEIAGSFCWLTELLGRDPVSFCFPGGRYSTKAVQTVFQSGYKIARTTELLSVIGQPEAGVSPTTLQVYDHSFYTYSVNLLKRMRIKNLIQWLTNNTSCQLTKMTEAYIDIIQQKGGCFHLWGHSWEIEQFGLWRKLEEIFKILSNRRDFEYIQNQQLLSIK